MVLVNVVLVNVVLVNVVLVNVLYNLLLRFSYEAKFNDGVGVE